VTRATALAIVVAATAVLSGCQGVGYLAYLVAPNSKQKVPAEFDGLSGHTAAVVIYTDLAVQYDYPYARLGLSMAICSEIRKNVPDVRLVPPERVISYQDSNINWEDMDRTGLGRALGADYLIYVPLDEYSTREPGSVNLFQGRIRGQAMVYDCTGAKGEPRLWEADELSVTFPENAPAGVIGQDDSKIRYETEKLFADLLAKKFYKHEVLKYQ
jgi:hypothetical protein